jgi:hypothetical protein
MDRKRHHCAGLLLAFILLLTACEGGFTATGSSERSHTTVNSGWIEKSIRKANGSATQKIEIEWPGRRLETNVTLEVGGGTFRIELLDGEGNVTLSVEATPGRPVSDSGFMKADAFGDARYRVTAVEAKDVKYRIEFDIIK